MTTHSMLLKISTATEKAIQSRVGKRPVVLPKGVTVAISPGKLDVKGPKGALSMNIPPTISVPYRTVTFSNGRVMSFQYLAPPYR